MSESLVKGQGVGIVANTIFQLLNPAQVHGATNFNYDFFIQGTGGVTATGIWQKWSGSAYVDMVDPADGLAASGVAGINQSEWLKEVVIDAASTGLVRIERTAGTLGYWYVINGGRGGGSFPTTLASQGSISGTTTEFFLETGKVYTITSDGTHSWAFSDSGTGWTPFDNATDDGFSFEAPASRRIQLTATGAVNFNISSRNAGS